MLLIAGVTLGVAGVATSGHGAPTLELVKGFQGWMKVTPSRFDWRASPLCFARRHRPNWFRGKRKKNPHFQRFFTLDSNKKFHGVVSNCQLTDP